MLYVLDLAPPERISRTVIEFFAVERAITLFQSFLVMLLEHRTDVPSSLVVYLLQVVLALGAYMLYLLNKVESPRLLISQRKGLEAKAALLTLYGGEKDVGRGHDEMLNHSKMLLQLTQSWCRARRSVREHPEASELQRYRSRSSSLLWKLVHYQLRCLTLRITSLRCWQ